MTPRQVALVQQSWTLVQPIADKAAELFYMRLFSLEPSVRRLFKGDMAEQGRKLTSMISVAVNSLAPLETIVPAVRALGRRHAGYRGEKFTGETEAAWRTAYRVLAPTMQSNPEEKNHAGQPAVS